MAVRRRRLYPDRTIDTATYGPVDFLSDQAFLEAVLAAAQTVALAGGVLTVLVERHPTDLPQEMVTTGAVIEWKDRTNAKAQPEAQEAVAPAPPATQPVVDLQEEMNELRQGRAAHADDIGDGLDPATLEEEDVSSIPEPAR